MTMNNTSSFLSSLRSDPYVVAVATLIMICGFWGASFSHSCQSDGCIGAFFPIGASAVLLLLQLAICLPVLALRWRRRHKPVAAPLLTWAALSIVCFVLPLLFFN